MISDALAKAILLRVLFYTLAIAGLVAMLHWVAASVIYQGSASIPDPAAANAIGAQDVWLTARDGTKINGWWLRSEGSHLVTLFLHGNAGNLGHRADHIAEIAAAGSDVLIIDYRGYGRSQGHPTERGLSMDADAAYDFVAAKGKPIVLHGESLGSAVAVEVALARPELVRCLVLVGGAPWDRLARAKQPSLVLRIGSNSAGVRPRPIASPP